MTGKEADQHDSHEAVEQSAPQPAANTFRNRWWMLIALVSITFFFDGCDSGEPEFTLGVVPYAECSFGDLGWGKPVKLLDFWPLGLVLNLTFIGIASYVLMATDSKRILLVRKFLSNRVTGIAFILTVGIFNSFLLVPGVWMYGVFTPTNWILQPFGEDPSIIATRIAGRVLFAAWVLLLTGLLIGLGRLLARYVLVDGRRWWQVKLGGLFILMVVFGTLLGVIGRIVVQNQNVNPQPTDSPVKMNIVDPSTNRNTTGDDATAK